VKVAYRRDTGEYVDNEESAPRLGLGYHPDNLKRLGLTPDDIVVMDVPPGNHPWDKKLVDGKLVADTAKLVARAKEEEAARVKAEKAAAARRSAEEKLKALGLTADEVVAVLGGGR